MQKVFAAGFIVYLNERFPPVAYISMIILFFVSGYLLPFAINKNISGIAFMEIIFGVILVLIFYLRLRIFDDFKDFCIDIKIHPERPVQRGIISLNELGIVAILAVIIESLIVLVFLRQVLIVYIIALIFSAVMLYEFFCRKSLRKDIYIYALPHILIMPILGLIGFFASADKFNETYFIALVIYLAICYFSGLVFEISRKMHSAQELLRKKPSFSKRFGFVKSFMVLNFLILSTFLCIFFLWSGIYEVQIFPKYFFASILLYLIIISSIFILTISFREKILSINNKSYALLGSIVIMLSYLATIVIELGRILK